MQKILLLLAKLQMSTGLYCLRLLERKARSDSLNAEKTILSVGEILVGTSKAIQLQSKLLPTLSQKAPPIEDIKKLMTLLAYHGSIMRQTQKSGLEPLAISKNDLERSVN